MSKTRNIVTIMAAGILITGGVASPGVAGTAADAKTRARTQSTISIDMSARTLSIPVDEFALTSELPAVHFDFNSATIRAADRSVLDANAQWLRTNAGQPVALGGGADPRGSKDHNLALAERRARAVRNYLVAKGVAPERITVLSTGEIQRPCRDQECWNLDRRVDFLVKKLPRQAP
jgi:peptidoglycan-associated lipoprotein